ncbi:MAG: tetratricopeptide repeat protein [Sphingobacteriales bacterium]|nr:MAG: tetratricopeptide repeat protein [Sphingobacteriales bacterium]
MLKIHKTDRVTGWITMLFLFLVSCRTSDSFAQDKSNEINVRMSPYIYNNKPDSAFLHYKQQYDDALLAKKPLEQGKALQQMGVICYHLGHYAQALEYYLDAVPLFEETNSQSLLAGNYNNMGILYFYNRDTQKARQCYNKALQIFTHLNEKNGIAVTYGKLGHIFEKQHEYDTALYYQQHALDVCKTTSNNHGMAKIYENIGSIYEDLGSYDTAMQYFTNANKLYEASGDKVEGIEVMNNIGDVYRKTGHYAKAIDYTRIAINQAIAANELYQLSSGYRDLAKGFALMQQNDSAVFYLELSRKYLLDIYSRESSQQMAFLQAQYNSEKQNNEIRSLQNARKITTIVTVSVIVIVLLLIVLGLAILNRQKLKIRNEREISEQNKHILETQNRLMEVELKSRDLEEGKLKTELRNRQLEKEMLDTELKNKALEETQLKQQIEVKTKELSTQALHVIQKNQLLEELRNHLDQMVKDDKRDQKKQLKQLSLQINQNFNNDTYWEDFRNTFEQVHQSFFDNLKEIAPDLTAAELRLVSLLKMNMSSNDMATMLGISQDSLRVSRYRLRKKLNLEQGENLYAFLQSIGSKQTYTSS